MRFSSDDESIVVMDPQVQEIAREISEAVEKRLQIHFENVQTLIRLSAEGHEARFDAIDRTLEELNARFETRLSDHDLTLADHNKRITRLEKRR